MAGSRVGELQTSSPPFGAHMDAVRKLKYWRLPGQGGMTGAVAAVLALLGPAGLLPETCHLPYSPG